MAYIDLYGLDLLGLSPREKAILESYLEEMSRRGLLEIYPGMDLVPIMHDLGIAVKHVGWRGEATSPTSYNVEGTKNALGQNYTIGFGRPVDTGASDGNRNGGQVNDGTANKAHGGRNDSSSSKARVKPSSSKA